ncbi:sacsin-like [Dendronephthya gigantea]|uniref:sacsin-like n=1 Tax=Dendronephthya gigantea TaxID=151771 RepID=UPI001069C457|nr:sacsin-like [Dendronephthya gigantea]
MEMASLFEEDLFEQTGQYEPLTTRLRNILREYKDGVGIFKELIQNADDAGATKVKFLVDWRHGRTESLFSPGMAECQGPALWAYNDAVFTDDDFENINKLAGETKVGDISKIGRFGLGFNAVYHLTDVPSFISREHLVVFDPNTHHLQRHIKDRSRPGIRLNLSEKSESLTRYQDQFQPYNGVFGCNTTETREAFHYNGTLFRFPFRTTTQAKTSDIIKTAYGRDKVQSIVRSLCECAETLLIFSQHVKEVEVFELSGRSQPGLMRLVLSVKKPSVQVLSQEGVNDKEPFIKQCSKWWGKHRESQMSCDIFPSSCKMVNIVTTKERSELNGCNSRKHSNQKWRVVSASGRDASLEIARSPEGRARGFLPCGGAAFAIQKAAKKRSYSDLSGELFCFLPLSISTGLPVHVNGYFAIMSNRVELWKRSIIGSQAVEVNWNEALMEDALARAYIMLLENMKDLIGKEKGYRYHSLWPSSDTVDMKSWAKLVQKICSVLLDPNSKLFYCDGNWMSVNDGYILSDEFTEIYETTVDVLRSLGTHVFSLPRNISNTLRKYDKSGILQRRILSFTVFIQKYFLPNIRIFLPSQRDAIVCFGLDRISRGSGSFFYRRNNESELIDLFKTNRCISVSQNQMILVKPCELIHPSSVAAKLFSEQDHRFPAGNDLRDANRLYVLETLGMVRDLDWAGVYERAQSVAKTRDLGRCRKLIKYIRKRSVELSISDYHQSSLQRVKFLPVLKYPVEEYPLPWKGSSLVHSYLLYSPINVFLPEHANLIGSSCLIVDISEESGCGEINAQVADILGFLSRRPEDKFVFQQLDEAISFWNQLSEEEKQETEIKSAIESICQSVYNFFDEKVVGRVSSLSQTSFLNSLANRHWLFLDGKFVKSSKVAFTSNGIGSPFLFTLPSYYIRNYRNLFQAMKIKNKFDVEDYISALYELKKMKQELALTENEFHIALFFINEIDVENPVVENHKGKIPLPDTERILRRSRDVVVNLDLWLEDPDNHLKVHEKISAQTAHALGAKPLKNVILKKCSSRIGYGDSFGQHEELTDRIKGIVHEYPVDGILKELVQNADDAQASEIHFIHDTRSDLPYEKVATEDGTTEEIQGPALCVYNDRPFTKKDIEGIKNLGIGSKRGSPEMTGRYGIGFNSVYNLTDCPSFLSNDDTLVILDPHRRYVLDEDPGKLFTLNTNLRHIFSDTLKGYLADHFKLKGSTMFRFPLRKRDNESRISKFCPDLKRLLATFQKEAKRSLLFLNHVKKITLSTLHQGNKLETIYCVESVISSEDEEKRRQLTKKILDQSNTPTAEIEWQEVSYILAIKEGRSEVEKWLIQKCFGSVNSTSNANITRIPDGHHLGLLPRGGVAARLCSHCHETLRGIVYCSLPLPENYTGLPVHVNGHFALDNTRRGLWSDTYGRGAKCDWNKFMLRCVLPPAYAALIKEARNHLCDDEADDCFSRYHRLFPKIGVDSSWKTLTSELYQYLGQTKAKVLPLLIPEDKATGISLKSLVGGLVTFIWRNDDPEQPPPFRFIEWMSSDQVYFKDLEDLENEFLYLLLRIGLPVLLHAPYQIYDGYRSVGMPTNKVNPKNVIRFLSEFQSIGSTCKIGNLPKNLENTVFKSVEELLMLMKYCCKDADLGKQLKGLPLLLTQDGCLRIFKHPVFRSKFGDLIPTQSDLFIHSEIVHQIPLDSTESEEDVVRNFTEKDLARLLPNVFLNETLIAIKDRAAWELPPEGPLSEKWLERVWDFLQNHTKPGPEEDSVSLDCLSKWPIVPTEDGKLVTVKDAKYILDMTVLGNESAQQQNVRTFLKNLGCPVLNKQITFQEKSTRNVRPVLDPYVAHPHKVEDVLLVLCHMLERKELDTSKLPENDIPNFLRFVQDDYERSEHLEDCKQMVKELPFHKTLDGKLVSLLGPYSSYALVPSGVPTPQLDELQKRAKSLFLDSYAIDTYTLKKLYTDLGVIGGKDVKEFYVEYVFKYFDIFTGESQLEHLKNIKENIFPSLPRGYSREKETFLKSFKETPCIPDINGRPRVASEFFDTKNAVFRTMFVDDPEKFPSPPFDDEDWRDLLCSIGLQVDVTPQCFLQFCETVAINGKRSPESEQYHQQSKELVNCLFSEEALQNEEFLVKISEIGFIASATMEDELASIHKPYECSQNIHPPFIEFRDAVPWHLRDISWTTVPVLPAWAQPNEMDKWSNLGIADSGPAYTKVIDHLQNIVSSPSLESCESSLLGKVTTSIYTSLSDTMQCSFTNSHDSCEDVCKDIGARLEGSSCIFLQEDKTFVKAEQLVFRVSSRFHLKPFLFPVPPEFGELQHFFKRLGATERPTPQQIAYALRSIHEQIGEEMLSAEQQKQTKYAMRVIFRSLHKGQSADGINELYLPTQCGRLLKSSETVCKVSPRFTEVVKNLERPILLRFGECCLKKIADSYIDALPEHLTPIKFGDIVRESVSSECKRSVCPEARDGSICKFQEEFQDLLQSDEFQEGLKRLLSHDQQKPKAFAEVIKKLQTDVKMKCVGFERVKIDIIRCETNEVLDTLAEVCYAVKENDTWSFYMQHDFKDDRIFLSTASCINKILGDCIKREMGLIAMVSCSLPSEISAELDRLDIAYSSWETADDSDVSDDESELDEAEHGRSRHSRGLAFGHDDGAGLLHQWTTDRMVDERFYPQNPGEMFRWLKQSMSDLDSAKWLLQAGPPFDALACFQSHQVVEKCLKGMLFYSCGIPGELLSSHNVENLAMALRGKTELPDDTAMQSVRTVAGYYLSTRYPNRQPFDIVPAEAFDANEAQRAINAASKVFTHLVENFLKD